VFPQVGHQFRGCWARKLGYSLLGQDTHGVPILGQGFRGILSVVGPNFKSSLFPGGKCRDTFFEGNLPRVGLTIPGAPRFGKAKGTYKAQHNMEI